MSISEVASRSFGMVLIQWRWCKQQRSTKLVIFRRQDDVFLADRNEYRMLGCVQSSLFRSMMLTLEMTQRDIQRRRILYCMKMCRAYVQHHSILYTRINYTVQFDLVSMNASLKGLIGPDNAQQSSKVTWSNVTTLEEPHSSCFVTSIDRPPHKSGDTLSSISAGGCVK